MNNTQVAPIALKISDIPIRQDDQGRYCLNDLHKAAGNDQKHRPKYWLESQQTKDLISELELEGGIPPSNIIVGRGKAQGTYVAKELVYAYAMWISASFSLKVIRAYDALQNQPLGNTEQLPAPSMSLDGRILLTIRNGQIVSSEPLPERAKLFTPNDAPSIRSWVFNYIPAQYLHIVMEAVTERSLAISSSMTERLPVKDKP